jgi:hypothetical protein
LSARGTCSAFASAQVCVHSHSWSRRKRVSLTLFEAFLEILLESGRAIERRGYRLCRATGWCESRVMPA